jgi:L-glyceraldehyde 3-phosphate reductase
LSEANVRCLVYQGRYSLLEQQVEVDGILTWLESQGIGCVGFSPLAQGMLTAKYLHGLPSQSRAARAEGFLKVEQVAAKERMIRSLDEVARNHGVSLYHLALAWTLRGSGVASSIVGARNVAQLKELLSVVRHFELPEDVWREVACVVKN